MMLRHGALSAACAARAISRRQLSTTAPRYIRIKKPEGAEPPKPTPAPKAPEQPSPAEKPASVPPTVDAGKPFEAEVNAPNTATEAPAPGAASEPLASAVPPSEPPKPEQAEQPAAKAEEVVEEFPDKPDLSKLPSLNIDPEAQIRAQEAIEQPKEDAKGGPKRTGAGKKPPKYETSIDRKRRNMARLGFASLVVGAIAAAYYVGEEQGEKEGAAKEKKSFIEQFKANFTALGDIFSKPAFDVLLPDPLPPPHQRPYTLLVDLDDMLVHSSWDRQHGWRTAKRPGVDYFLGYLSQFYEIVLFSSQPSFTGMPIAEKLDPLTLYLPYKLFREATRYVDGKVVKDIDYLNRDLKKVVMLETNPEHAHLHPDNAIILPKWDGKPGDKGLIEMIPFLESIAIFAPQDVRPVLKHYAGKDIPREYAKKEAEQKAAAIAEWERTHANKGSSWTSSLFGGGQTRPQQPMTYLEMKRQQAQRAYQEEQKYYNEHKEEFLRLIEEDRQRQMEAMKGSMFGLLGGGDAAKQQQEAAAQAQAQQAQQQQK